MLRSIIHELLRAAALCPRLRLMFMCFLNKTRSSESIRKELPQTRVCPFFFFLENFALESRSKRCFMKCCFSFVLTAKSDNQSQPILPQTKGHVIDWWTLRRKGLSLAMLWQSTLWVRWSFNLCVTTSGSKDPMSTCSASHVPSTSHRNSCHRSPSLLSPEHWVERCPDVPGNNNRSNRYHRSGEFWDENSPSNSEYIQYPVGYWCIIHYGSSWYQSFFNYCYHWFHQKTNRRSNRIGPCCFLPGNDNSIRKSEPTVEIIRQVNKLSLHHLSFENSNNRESLPWSSWPHKRSRSGVINQNDSVSGQKISLSCITKIHYEEDYSEYGSHQRNSRKEGDTFWNDGTIFKGTIENDNVSHDSSKDQSYWPYG